MNRQQHLAPDEMHQLLFGNPDDQDSQVLASHIDDCRQCQQALDQMAATPDLWTRAAELITERHLSETVAVAIGSPPRQPEQEQERAADSVWEYPVETLLDRPSHPEMLGRIGHYDIEREIGRGGMGVVFKGYDAELNRPVAIKVLAPHLAANGAARKRFAREARAAAAVLHPNVIAIHGVSSAGKTPYIVMPYVAGPSLRWLVERQGPLGEKEMVRIALQISSGLAAAHSQGLVHRDIKPANILIEANVSRILITDFGLARAENDASMTRTGWLAGTPNFMSPEQAHGRPVDGRSDLFSLGSVIYYMATGRLPFRAETPMAVLNRICHDPPNPVRQVNPDISKTLADIVDRCLAKNPDERFRSTAALHQTLEQFLAFLHQPEISKPPVVRVAKPGRWSSLSPPPGGWKLAVPGLLLLLPLLVWLGSGLAWRGETGPPGDSPEVGQLSVPQLQRELTREAEQIQELSRQLQDMDQQMNELRWQLRLPDTPTEPRDF